MLHDEKSKKIIVAAPVDSKSAMEKLQNTRFTNEVICPSVPANFRTVGQFYKNFDNLDDAELIAD